MDAPLRVMIVDDSVTYRQLGAKALEGLPGVEVVGTAPNGKIALERLEALHAEVLLLDLEMPQLDGLEVLRRLQADKSPVKAIMLSAFTSVGATATVEALELGAFDFVLKPSGGSFDDNLARLRQELRQRLEAFGRAHRIRRILGHAAGAGGAGLAAAGNGRSAGGANGSAAVAAVAGTRVAGPSAATGGLPMFAAGNGRVDAVVLGISTGGPPALTRVLPQLPGNLRAPLLIVQHMPAFFTKSLAEDLDRRCQLRVCEAADGLAVTAGRIYIAPGGRQMKVQRESGLPVLRITDDPPENSCRPSVDYLFRSAAAVYGGKTLGVIMTGMGNDGSRGCRDLKARGATIIAQNEASCVVFGMPREPIEQGVADAAVSLEGMAAEITRLTGRD